MNIFVSNPDPIQSAIALDDKRLVKMVLETAQLMSTAINLCGGTGPYKTTHVNHPCSIWIRTSRGNYAWALEHFKALSKEYSRRFGRTHKCYSHIKTFELGLTLIPQGELTPFKNCTMFKDIENVFDAYKACLNKKWADDRSPKWTLATRPSWFSL